MNTLPVDPNSAEAWVPPKKYAVFRRWDSKQPYWVGWAIDPGHGFELARNKGNLTRSAHIRLVEAEKPPFPKEYPALVKAGILQDEHIKSWEKYSRIWWGHL